MSKDQPKSKKQQRKPSTNRKSTWRDGLDDLIVEYIEQNYRGPIRIQRNSAQEIIILEGERRVAEATTT